jgi:hypothetical protein
VLAGLVAAPAGWLVTDQLESRNEFCTSCHLDAATPLHEPKMGDFLREPAESRSRRTTRPTPGSAASTATAARASRTGSG